MFNPDGCFCCLPPEDPCTTSNCTFLSNEMSDFEINPYWTQVTGSGAVGNGSYTVTNAQDLDVGNDAPCRRVTVETTLATTSADSVYVVCWKKSSGHNPSTQCPVTSLTFCVESKRVSESDGQVRFFIKQNGSTYVTKTGFSIGVNWKRATGTFSQSDFEELSSGAQPNFTATGTAIEFGFGLKIPVNSGDEPFADVWFDNLCVVVAKNCTTSCAGDDCDFLADMLSGTMTHVSSHVRGVSSYTSTAVSVDTTDGFSGSPCLKIVNSLAQAGSGNTLPGGAWDVFKFDGYTITPDPCKKIAALASCATVKSEVTWASGAVKGYGSIIKPIVFQDGNTYIHIGLQQHNFPGMSFSAGTPIAISDWVTHRAITTCNSDTFKKLLSFVWPTACVDAVYCGIGLTPPAIDSSSSPDFSMPFETGLAIYTKCSGSSVSHGPVTFKLDDYCVRPITSRCYEASEYNVSLSGLSIVKNSILTCANGSTNFTALAAELDGVLGSSVVLSFSGACTWSYRYLSSVVSGASLTVRLFPSRTWILTAEINGGGSSPGSPLWYMNSGVVESAVACGDSISFSGGVQSGHVIGSPPFFSYACVLFDGTSGSPAATVTPL